MTVRVDGWLRALRRPALQRAIGAGLAGVGVLIVAGDAVAAPRERERGRQVKAVATKAATAKPAATKAEVVPTEPLTVVVSIGGQRLAVYAGTEQIAAAPVSTGKRGDETPPGIYSIIQKNRMHFSNLYDGAPMPFMQRLTWSGIALHAGHLPGYPASHGCVRMPHEFARRLFSLTRMGARVIVTHGDARPRELSHPRLAALAPATLAARATLAEPMRLGAGREAEPASEAESASGAGGSLLKRAQAAVAERMLALEAARAVQAATAGRLEETGQTLRQAREAMAQGRGEAGRVRQRLRGYEAEVAAYEARLKAMAQAGVADAQRAGALEDRLDAELQRLAAAIEEARKQLDESEELLREIGEELAEAETAGGAAHRAHDDATMRVRIAEDDLKEARRTLQKRQLPIHMLFSRKTGKLYVRQGFEPLLETQASLDDPDLPVGTHVLTVQAMRPGEPLRWTAVTVGAARVAAARVEERSGRRGLPGSRKAAAPEPRPVQVATATPSTATALDRLQLPPAVIDQIGDLIQPGSSLIISDQPPSRETGKGTDLIVDIR